MNHRRVRSIDLIIEYSLFRTASSHEATPDKFHERIESRNSLRILFPVRCYLEYQDASDTQVRLAVIQSMPDSIVVED